MGIVLGFSGSREGVTPKQRDALLAYFKANQVHELHHGACAGADAVCQRTYITAARSKIIIMHPGPYGPHRSCLVFDYTALEDYDWRQLTFRLEPNLPFLQRSTDIVNESDVIICAPKSLDDRKSGTWSVINRARKAGKELIILEP